MVNKSATKDDFRLKLALADQRYLTGRTAIRAVAVVACVYLTRDILLPFAGKSTEIIVSILADIKLIVSFAVAGLAGLWAFLERRLRFKKVEYLQNRVRELELKLDPSRTTSGLTTKGKTNPRDRER